MSFNVFFAFSAGLSKPITVPKGTLASVIRHVENIEDRLGLEREQYQNNPVHWAWRGWPAEDLDDKVLCEGAEEHNSWVRWFYDRLAYWSKNPPADGEIITPDDAKTFWHGLQTLTVPPRRWTGDYYSDRMKAIYEVMRGRPDEGMTFDEDALTAKQAGAVIRLFEQYLDPSDMRLEVPKGCDYLASSYYGEYDWCTKCGAVLPETANACRERACPAQAELCGEDRPIWFREEDETDEAFEARCRERAEAQGWVEAGTEDHPYRFTNDDCGSRSRAESWAQLWEEEGER